MHVKVKGRIRARGVCNVKRFGKVRGRYCIVKCICMKFIRLLYGGSLVRFPARVNPKILVVVRDLLSTPVSARDIGKKADRYPYIHKATKNKHYNKSLQRFYTTSLLRSVGAGSRSVPTRCHSVITSRMNYSGICRMSEEKVPSYKLHMTLLL